MATLSRELRKTLENVVAEAREVAEEAAGKALESLAAERKDPYGSMTPVQKDLRNRLRAHGRQLGDRRNVEKGTQELNHLVVECAYEQWHRLLFARFLAENHLLLEPESGVAIAIEEVKELARGKGQDWVVLAGEYAVRMLPQVFRQDDPVLEVQLAPEDRKRLEELLDSLPSAVFTADDSLGWTYQFWQAEEKDAINASGEKIGAEELGPVTQLFTEDYMVAFLLHNSLGAWWVGRRHGGSVEATSESEARAKVALPGVTWTYLRFLQDEKTGHWRPAAGTFDGWPMAAKDVTVLDPCMGSGHFLVFALPTIAAMRAAEEGLSVKAATLAALQDNLFGLELDQRCTQIAAFNLALTAWRLVGHCVLPAIHLACSGLAPNANEADWQKLAGGNQKLQRGMERLYRLFKQAPVLGSLINPRAGEGDLLVAAYHELQPLLDKALGQEAKDDTTHEMAVTARGLTKAAEILAGQFTLVATNVPYLGRGSQDDVLKDHCKDCYPDSQADLAACFVERCQVLCDSGRSNTLVIPQTWLFQGRYESVRRRILQGEEFNLLAKLGPRAFETIGGEIVNVVCLILSQQVPRDDFCISGIDVSAKDSALEKARALCNEKIEQAPQVSLLNLPKSKISLAPIDEHERLDVFASALHGQAVGDNPSYNRSFWEIESLSNGWEAYQSQPDVTCHYGGRHSALHWENEAGRMAELANSVRHLNHKAQQWRSGKPNWGKRGIAISLVGRIYATLYSGDIYAQSCCVIVPHDRDNLSAIWCFAESGKLESALRQLDSSLGVSVKTVISVPFDLAHWQKVAAEKYPSGLPKPFSSDPTQWLFNGQPQGSYQPLHVAVARLVGYKWPRQTGSSFPDCPALGSDSLEPHADSDGIVCLDSLKGEDPAEARLRKLLAAAYGKEWSAVKQAELLAQVDSAGRSLDDWLRDGFFEQHCDLFHQRPFVWHICDGLRDGFHVLVNYHKLAAPDGKGRRTLEKLTFTYLGEWIARQKAEQKTGKEAADAKLAAALHLQGQLKEILEGEPPYDIFVRWKPLYEQAIGWDPDINDGVRMNIRPFMMTETLKGKSIFRKAPRIKWGKDKGKEPERPKRDFPWFWGWDEETEDFKGRKDFDGIRWNDLHYSNGLIQEVRARHKGKIG